MHYISGKILAILLNDQCNLSLVAIFSKHILSICEETNFPLEVSDSKNSLRNLLFNAQKIIYQKDQFSAHLKNIVQGNLDT